MIGDHIFANDRIDCHRPALCFPSLSIQISYRRSENAMSALLPKADIASFSGPLSAWRDVADFKRTRFEPMQTAYEDEATKR